ncbi:MAG: anaerobic carbon-monoxide dehydrogenase catalytic subunit [Coriobacteriia bacterium]|nr:anaerobic carbon-monoxide dehydrogenase catalytic subunit [Coriobacteriia bacterium]
MSQEKTIDQKSIWEDARAILAKAEREGIETVWDRYETQTPHCTFCELGTTCRNCMMGPCRINANPNSKMKKGVCGANEDTIVARNFARFVAGGSSSHSDHGRDLINTLSAIADGNAPGYAIKDEAKLRAVAKELGVHDANTGDVTKVAKEVAERCYEQFGSKLDHLTFAERAPQARQDLWNSLKMMPRGIDREVVEMMHRTHMGCDNDPVSLLIQAARCALADGWGGSMIGTELSDAIFGTPSPITSQVDLAVLKADCVNIMVHGHNPVVSEMVLAAAREPELVERAKSVGASGGINVVGLCCTGNELMMRQGIPMAGNHLMTELALITGAVEAIVVDYQCIMPSLVHIASCYQTQFISTSPKGRFPGEIHKEVTPANAQAVCREIVEMAIEAFTKRDPNRVEIPGEPVSIMTGFSNEAILGALGGTPEPLLDAIKSGAIKGAVGVVGCNNPRVQHDSSNVAIVKELIAKGMLVLVTGCVTNAVGKAGLLVPEAAQYAAPGLRAVCESLGIPPVLHVGSCVDNSRILSLCAALANALGVDISDLPVAASAPEWYSEKAAAIGLYAVASGVPVHLGVVPNITGSALVTEVATSGLNDVVGASFIVEPDPVAAAEKIEAVIDVRRAKLGI